MAESDHLRRNISKKQPIDSRYFQAEHLYETDNGFTMSFLIRDDTALDKPFKFDPRIRSDELQEYVELMEAFYSFLTLLDTQTYLITLDHELEIRKLSQFTFEVNLGEFLTDIDATLFDEVRIHFKMAENQMVDVVVEVHEAWDKEIHKALNSILRTHDAEKYAEVWWLKLEWLIGRVLRVTHILCDKERYRSATMDFAPHETFYDTDVFVQWVWEDPETLELEAIGEKHATPKLSDEQIAKLENMGWNRAEKLPEVSHDNLTIRITNQDFRTTAKFIVETLRSGFKCHVDDLIVIRPRDVSELVIDLEKETKHQNWCYPQGLLYPEDVDLLYNKHNPEV